MPEYQIKPNDLTAFVTSLIELFAEYQDKVTPLMLSQRMTAKVGRPITYQNVSYLFTQFGFVTRIGGKDKMQTGMRYIVPDFELLKRLKADLPKIEERTRTRNDKKPFSLYSAKTVGI